MARPAFGMTHNLLVQIGLSTGMVVFSVLIHLVGLSLLIALMSRHTRQLDTRRTRLLQALVLMGAAFGLFALHTVEIWAYAFLYFVLGATGSFEDALYFSTVTYATIGYGDLTLPREWRILGAIEGANGVILLGWSTAFFVSVVARIRILEHDWLQVGEPPGDRPRRPQEASPPTRSAG